MGFWDEVEEFAGDVVGTNMIDFGDGLMSNLSSEMSDVDDVDTSAAEAAIADAIQFEMDRYNKVTAANEPYVAMGGAADNFLQDPEGVWQDYRTNASNDYAAQHAASTGSAALDKAQAGLADRRTEAYDAQFWQENATRDLTNTQRAQGLVMNAVGPSVAGQGMQAAGMLGGLASQGAAANFQGQANTISGLANIGGVAYSQGWFGGNGAYESGNNYWAGNDSMDWVGTGEGLI